VTSDLLADRGVKLADFEERTIAALEEVFPAWMKPSHPVDVWPSVELNGLEPVYAKAIEAVMEDPGVDSVIVETIAWDLASPGYLAAAGEMQRRHRKPVVLWQIGAMDISERYRAAAEDAGIPVFTEISRCVAFIAGVKAHSKKKETVRTS
jgi:acyl-CoA synthetase (NDP forming)